MDELRRIRLDNVVRTLKAKRVAEMVEKVNARCTDDLADIIYRIDPEEVPLLASMGHWQALTPWQSKKLGRLRRQKKWKQWGRYMASLNRRRKWIPGYAEAGASRVLTEWLIQELNGRDDDLPAVFTVERRT